MLDKMIKQYEDQAWFLKAWEEYRHHVLTSDMEHMRTPGYVFKKYIKDSNVKHSDEDSEDPYKYGVPEQKKFPLPDANHVRSAIKFFNYVDPKYEKQLAQAILKRAKEYEVNILEINIGDDNRFKKYLPNYELQHHGIKGQKWGVRNYQNQDGTLTPEGRLRYGVESKEGSYTNRASRESESNLKSGGRITAEQKDKLKKAAIVGATVAATALAVYGAYKISEARKDAKYERSVEYGLDFYRQMYRDNVGKANVATNKFEDTVKELNELKRNNASGQKEVRVRAGRYLQEEADYLDKAKVANRQASKYFNMGG